MSRVTIMECDLCGHRQDEQAGTVIASGIASGIADLASDRVDRDGNVATLELCGPCAQMTAVALHGVLRARRDALHLDLVIHGRGEHPVTICADWPRAAAEDYLTYGGLVSSSARRDQLRAALQQIRDLAAEHQLPSRIVREIHGVAANALSLEDAWRDDDAPVAGPAANPVPPRPQDAPTKENR